MASHSGYPHPHTIHHTHPGPHLPPLPTTHQTSLPSLRSLNFSYEGAGGPQTSPLSQQQNQQPQQQQQQQQQQTPQLPQRSFSQEDYYTRETSLTFYQGQDTSSSSQPPVSSPARKPRLMTTPSTNVPNPSSNSNPRSPYSLASYDQRNAGNTYTQHQQHPHQEQQQPQPVQYSEPSSGQYFNNHTASTNRVASASQWYYSNQASPQTQPQSTPPQQQQQPPTPTNTTQTIPQKTSTHSFPLTFQPSHPLAPPPIHSPHPQQQQHPQQHPQQQQQLPQHRFPAQAMFPPSATSSPAFSATTPAPPPPPPIMSVQALTNTAKAFEEDADKSLTGGMYLSKIVEQSRILHEFSSRYAAGGVNRPSPDEMAEMAERANVVLRHVDKLRKLAFVEEEDNKRKKRPWEDDIQTGVDDGHETMGDNGMGNGSGTLAGDSIAHKDMELIRSKRGQGVGAAGGPPGQPKAKYRKRSQRANPPGKCHSCNIRETPEWRRGPDGARTLCNACGLHYAKLMRKREKTLGPDGNAEAPAISVEMLRASTRTDTVSKASAHMEGADMAEITLQPVPSHSHSQRGGGGSGVGGGMLGGMMQVHHWTPPGLQKEHNSFDLGAYSTSSLMRNSNARGSPT